ncbi:TPA: hypothetical protein DIC38_00350 [Candidatus Nomurabacteria bacterium]|nr:MAG: hypothetical protein O210_OD1C00001G0661 [Parcubacteria bacterium RAAC4_OD1_1]HCY26123.1 hypothetical protein [Candidatus Nomurabacteria bacterium]
MKKILQYIKNIFSKIKIFFKIDSHKHWNFIVQASFFIVCILICFSLFLLYQIKNDQITGNFEIKKDPVVIIKEDVLNEIISDFEEKENKSEETKNSVFPYSDPGR